MRGGGAAGEAGGWEGGGEGCVGEERLVKRGGGREGAGRVRGGGAAGEAGVCVWGAAGCVGEERLVVPTTAPLEGLDNLWGSRLVAGDSLSPSLSPFPPLLLPPRRR